MESEMFSAIEQRVRRRQFIHDVGEVTRLYVTLGLGLFVATCLAIIAVFMAVSFWRWFF